MGRERLTVYLQSVLRTLFSFSDISSIWHVQQLTSIFVLLVNDLCTSAISTVHSEADIVLHDAFGEGRKGTYTTDPPAISIFADIFIS
jgi:hypothetical protein